MMTHGSTTTTTTSSSSSTTGSHSHSHSHSRTVRQAVPCRSLMSSLLLAAGLSLTCAGVQAEGKFKLTSPDIQAGGRLTHAQVYQGFGCQGGNTSPALAWQGAPAGTQSFAITVYDPDAPTGSGWWHWVVYNLPATTTSLPAGAGAVGGSSLPAGATQGRTDFGTSGFGGACPPEGDRPHRYQFTVHALKTEKLELPADASAAMVGFMIHAHRLGSASLQAKYAR